MPMFTDAFAVCLSGAIEAVAAFVIAWSTAAAVLSTVRFAFSDYRTAHPVAVADAEAPPDAMEPAE